VDAAYRILAGMRQEVQRGVENYTAAAQWADMHGGLTGTLDADGRTFEQATQGRYANAGADPMAEVAPTAPPPPATRRTATLPPPRDLAEGTRARDSRTGREFIIRNGAWAPVSGGDRRGVLRDSN